MLGQPPGWGMHEAQTKGTLVQPSREGMN